MQVKQRLDALTSLRFIAAAMIVVTHAHTIFGSRLAMLVPMGQGVSFFFVLSGFILSWNYPVLADWGARRRFWLARFARIWPLHLVTCLLWIALIFDFNRGTYFSGVVGLTKLVANLLLVQVWVPLHDWGLSFNGVSWSISVEFFFYAMFPVLITLWQRRWHHLISIQVLVIAIFIGISTRYALPGNDDYPRVGLLGLIYFNPLVRIFEFSIGIALSKLVTEVVTARKLQFSVAQWLVIEIFALTAVAAGMLAAANFSGIEQVFGKATAYYFTREGLWLFWALLIGVFALSRGPLTRLMSLRFSVFLGEISFALYLSHALAIRYLENYIEQILRFGLFGYGVFWAWCLLFSAILFIGIETPFRKCILAFAAKKEIITAIRTNFRAKEIAALLCLICVAIALFFFSPSTIVKLDQASVAEFLQPTTENLKIPNDVSFDNRYEIAAIRAHFEKNETVVIQIMLHAAKNMKARDVLALHLNDINMNITSNFDRRLDFSRASIPAGTYWIQKFVVSKSQYDRAVSLGLAIYSLPTSNLPSTVFEGVGGIRDWGGKRLVVPLDH